MTRAATAPPEALPLTALPGVGPARAARLARLGLATVRDLLLLVPRKLEPPARRATAAEARELVGERVRVAGAVRGARLFRRGGRRSVLRVALADESGAIDLVFWNQPWLRERFPTGAPVEAEGRVVDAGGPALAAPRVAPPGGGADEPGDAERPTPLYPLTEGIGQELLRGLCRAACEAHADRLVERLAPEVLEEHGLPSLGDAVRAVHLAADVRAHEAGRRRVGLERLLALQARLQASPRARAAGAPRVAPGEEELARLCAAFPAPLTDAQLRAVRDVAADLAGGAPMRRLLQGDVGSGKTWVGALACLAAARAGFQAAFLAPTELLAEQHWLGLRELFRALGARPALLVGSLAGPRAREVREALASGAADVVFGTHALLGARVRFARLALAVIDEQHRFGVAQRARLLDKGRRVHALLMTATPIPRTLALTVYGDLDVSLVDRPPAGRGELHTRVVPPAKVPALRDFLAERAARGERAFWIAPRIEGEGGALAAFEAWRARVPAAELVHGRLPAAERARRMARFARGEAPLLVATTVVEVGVDVPAATAIAIDGADRLGLSQLHQLRGRVGRGAAESWCFLLGGPEPPERLRALERSRDGFELAELDLRLRGMGSLLGLRQAGPNDEGLEAAALDPRLAELARRAVREDPALRRAYAREGSAAR